MPPKRTVTKKAPATPEKKAEAKAEPKAEAPAPPPEPVKPKIKAHVPLKKKTGKDAVAIFDQKLIQSLKDAFEVMDDNHDGVIDKKDLQTMYGTIGQAVTEEEIDTMLKESEGPLNFDNFVQMFAERYSCRDTEEEILAGFKKFDPEDTGKITSEKFRYLIGNPKVYPLTERELRHVNKAKLPIMAGMVDYKRFTRLILKEPLDLLLKA